MNKKPFNEIEEQMKASAESWEPAFDEQSWHHMEKLLDGHDDRRKPLAWLLWLIPAIIGITIAGYFLFNQNDPSVASAGNSPMPSKKEIQIQQTPTAPVLVNTGNTEVPSSPAQNNIHQKSRVAKTSPPLLTHLNAALNKPLGIAHDKKKDHTNSAPAAPVSVSVDGDDPQQQNSRPRTGSHLYEEGKSNMMISPSIAEVPAIVEDSTKQQPSSSMAANTITDTKEMGVDKEILSKKHTGNKDSIKNSLEETIPQNQIAKNEKKNKVFSPFYIGLSGGIDGSGVDFPGLNKFAPRVGVTVGYHLNKNFSLAGGFFAGNKKYVAGKGDYKARPGSYLSTVDIEEVDANCRVFEIPLWLRYDFTGNKNLRPFVSLGISSFIMDKEDYEYYYYRFGNPYRASYTYKGNQHLFSVVRVASGIEKKISHNFFLSVQPGLAIPLGGVGDGQVKLFSTELLLGLKYRPFKKTK